MSTELPKLRSVRAKQHYMWLQGFVAVTLNLIIHVSNFVFPRLSALCKDLFPGYL